MYIGWNKLENKTYTWTLTNEIIIDLATIQLSNIINWVAPESLHYTQRSRHGIGRQSAARPCGVQLRHWAGSGHPHMCTACMFRCNRCTFASVDVGFQCWLWAPAISVYVEGTANFGYILILVVVYLVRACSYSYVESFHCNKRLQTSTIISTPPSWWLRSGTPGSSTCWLNT